MLELLITEFSSDSWSRFDGAIGFAKSGGTFPDLLGAMKGFAARSDTQLRVTFGADRFAGDTRGSDFDAVAEVLRALKDAPNARVFLYHERGRTFHPKLYLFSNESAARALLILGSSNWSEGGLVENIEANVVLEFNLRDGEHERSYRELREYFDTYWHENA